VSTSTHDFSITTALLYQLNYPVHADEQHWGLE